MMTDAELAAAIGLIGHLEQLPSDKKSDRVIWIARVKKELDWRYAVRCGEVLPNYGCGHKRVREFECGWYCLECARAMHTTVEAHKGPG